MKKNAMLKIAAILMVAVLLTTCAISSTFAKYTSGLHTVKAPEARVAKFGVTISGDTENADLFLNAYDAGETASVQGAGDDLVVAPGTTNSSNAFKLTITETDREVDVKLIATADVTLTGWEASGYYCPLVFTVEGSDPIDGATFTSAEAFETAIEEAIMKALLGLGTGETLALDSEGKYSKVYPVGTPINAAAADGVTVSWAWPFETNADNNLKDTTLGTAGTAKVALEFSLTAEQSGD